MFWWAVLIFFVGFAQSYLINTSAMTIITKSDIKQVVPVSLGTGLASRLSLLIIGKLSEWNLLVMGADLLGDLAGDIAVNRRWPKPIYDLLVRKNPKKITSKKPKSKKEITSAESSL